MERRTWDKESFAKRAQERKERGGEEKDESYIQQERVKVSKGLGRWGREREGKERVKEEGKDGW